jgi:hypothetical protein
VASALVAFLADFSAGVSLLRVPDGFSVRFDGNIDLISDFVDAIVDTDFMDIASFSDKVFMFVFDVEVIVKRVGDDVVNAKALL